LGDCWLRCCGMMSTRWLVPSHPTDIHGHTMHARANTTLRTNRHTHVCSSQHADAGKTTTSLFLLCTYLKYAIENAIENAAFPPLLPPPPPHTQPPKSRNHFSVGPTPTICIRRTLRLCLLGAGEQYGDRRKRGKCERMLAQPCCYYLLPDHLPLTGTC